MTEEVRTGVVGTGNLDTAWQVYWQGTGGADGSIEVRKTSPWSVEVPVPQAPQWKLEAFTTGKTAGIGPRTLEVTMAVTEEDGTVVVAPTAIKLNKMNERKSVMFKRPGAPGADTAADTAGNATLTLTASTNALLAPMGLVVQLAEEVDAAEVGGDSDATLADSFQVDLSTLPAAQRARVQEACVGWPDVFASSASPATYDPARAIKELERQSPEKAKARKLGLIRPFLYLVAMHPVRRLMVASTLKIALLSSSGGGGGSAVTLRYGDAHWEALHLLTTPRTGIQSRANRAFSERLNPLAAEATWGDILYRVMRHAFVKRQQVIVKNEDVDASLRAEIKEASGGQSERQLEELLTHCVIAKQMQEVPEEVRAMRAEVAAGPEARRICAGLRERGWSRQVVVDYAAVNAVLASRGRLDEAQLSAGWAANKRERLNKAAVAVNVGMLFVAPYTVVPLVMLAGRLFASTPGHLLAPLAFLLVERSWLAVAGVTLESYY